MQTIDITPTPAACRQIARLFRAQQAHSEETIERASRALDVLEGLDDSAIGPWDRLLLAAAFEALGEGERARVCHMRAGLNALGPDANADEDHKETPPDAAYQPPHDAPRWSARRPPALATRAARRGPPHPPGRRRRVHAHARAPPLPPPPRPARRGPPGRDVPDAPAPALALITVRLASGRQEDTYLRQIVSALGATLDATYEATGRRHGRAA